MHGTRTPSPDAFKASDDGGSVTEESDVDAVSNNLDIEKLPPPKEIELEGYTFTYGEETPKTPEKALRFTHDNKKYYVEVAEDFPSSLQKRLEWELDITGGAPDTKLINSVGKLFHAHKACRVGVTNTAGNGLPGGIVEINERLAQARTVNVQCKLVKKGARTPENAHSMKDGECTYAVTVDGKEPDAALLNTIHLENIDGSIPVGIVNSIENALQSGDGSDTASNRSLPEADPPRRERSDSVTSIMSRPASPTESVTSLSSVTLPDGFSVTEKSYKDAQRFFATDKNDNQTMYFVKSQRENGGFKRILDLNGLSQTDSFLCCELPVAQSEDDQEPGMLDRKQAFSLSEMLSVHQHTLHNAVDFECALHAAYAIVRDAPDMELNPEACITDFIKNMAEFEPMSQEEEDNGREMISKGDAFITTLHSQLSEHIEKPIQKSSFHRLMQHSRGTLQAKVLLKNYYASSPISVVEKVGVHYDFSGKVVATPTDETMSMNVVLDPRQRIDDVRAGLEALRKNQNEEGATKCNAENIPKLLKDAIAEAKQDREAKEAAEKAAQEAAQRAAQGASQEAPKKPRWDAF